MRVLIMLTPKLIRMLELLSLNASELCLVEIQQTFGV